MTEHETRSMTNAPMTNDQPTGDKQELITLAQAAERYGFTTSYLRILAAKKRLQAQKVGNIWLTTPAAVEEYIRSREKRGAFKEDIRIEEGNEA
jgi:hypothetical protein